jgi:hypothetical protein
LKVQTRARMLLSGSSNHPKRVNTGVLRASVQVQLIIIGSPKVRVGTNVIYAMLVHDGTGLYGPRRRRIVPRTRGVMRFRRYGKTIYTASTAGMKRNQFLKDALPAAKN